MRSTSSRVHLSNGCSQKSLARSKEAEERRTNNSITLRRAMGKLLRNDSPHRMPSAVAKQDACALGRRGAPLAAPRPVNGPARRYAAQIDLPGTLRYDGCLCSYAWFPEGACL